MKRLLAALSCMLLLGQMFAAESSLTCAAPTARACACCCRNMKMKCCATESGSRSQLPAIPARASAQNQLPILALTAWAFTSTQLESLQHNLSSTDLSSAASAVPIFQRDCAILI
jgi:hypothetical protein